MKQSWVERTIIGDVLRGNMPMRHCVLKEGEIDMSPEMREYHSKTFHSLVQSSHVVDASRVAKFYLEIDPSEYWEWKDLPILSPPYPALTVYFESPGVFNRGGNLVDSGVRTESLVSMLNLPWDLFITTPTIRQYLEGSPPHERNTFLQKGVGIDSVTMCFLAVNYYPPNGMPCVRWLKPHVWYIMLDQEGIYRRHFNFGYAASSRLDISVMIAMCAVGLFHCTKAKITDVSAERNPKYGKGFKGRKLPDLRYSTITIDALEKLIRENQDASMTGRQLALHTVRAHWKRYTKEGGGFRGTGEERNVWCPVHERGNKGHGRVTKDYQIEQILGT